MCPSDTRPAPSALSSPDPLIAPTRPGSGGRHTAAATPGSHQADTAARHRPDRKRNTWAHTAGRRGTLTTARWRPESDGGAPGITRRNQRQTPNSGHRSGQPEGEPLPPGGGKRPQGSQHRVHHPEQPGGGHNRCRVSDRHLPGGMTGRGGVLQPAHPRTGARCRAHAGQRIAEVKGELGAAQRGEHLLGSERAAGTQQGARIASPPPRSTWFPSRSRGQTRAPAGTQRISRGRRLIGRE